MSDKKSESIQQAELARLKAELAAAEARAALARAEAEAAIQSAALARAEADAQSEAAFEPHDSAVALADPPQECLREPTATEGTNGTHATNGNGKHAAPANKQATPPPPAKDKKTSWRGSVSSEAPPPAPASNAEVKPAEPPVAEVKAVSTQGPAEAEPAPKSEPAATAPPKKETSPAKEIAKKTSADAKSKAVAGAAASVPLADGSLPLLRDSDEEKEHTFLERILGRYAVSCMTSVSFSLVVHMVFLILLGMWFLPPLLNQTQEIIAVLDETPLEHVTQTLDTKMTPTNELSLTSSSPSATPLSGQESGAASTVNAPSLDNRVSENSDAPAIKVGDVAVMSRRGSTLTTATPDGTLGEPAAIVDNYQQAMDRITQEILLKLSKGKVLVVWCLDESESMKDDIKEIRMRIDKVYTELGLTTAAQGDSLLTSVISYGGQMNVHTNQPTSDIEKIRTAMDQVKVDESGLEMQCQTVGHAINQYRGFVTQGKRQMMLILVTDESGNPDENMQFVEPTIAEAKAARCPIYVLGREAVFGYPYAHMWTTVTVPAVGGGNVSRTWLLPIDRGPETPFVEQLQTEGFHRRHDTHASGFGPYEQVRMARETGGVFFMLPSPEVAAFDRDKTKNRKYELEALRPYMPDLSSRMDYANERDKHPDRLTIWKVINDLNPYKPEIAKHIDMRMTFSPQPSAFANQVNTELQKSVFYYQYLGAAEKALEDLKKQRDREPLPRWQANYDLIYAQLLAYEARLWEYGAYLEAFIKSPKQFDPPKPDRQIADWRIAMRKKRLGEAMAGNPSETSERRAKAQKNEALIARSTELFKAVIREHAGTPWAARAEAELNRGFGVELNAHYYNPLYVAPVPARPIVQPKL